jgi:hypothetical protein
VKDYFSEIKKAILHFHGCEASHVETVHVQELFQDKLAWMGDVEVFTLSGHAKAKRCYAWGHPEDKGDGWEITTVLEIPPVVSAETAVKVAIASASKD